MHFFSIAPSATKRADLVEHCFYFQTIRKGISMSSAPRHVERMRIGGGFGERSDGGADIEADGTIRTDGDVTVRGILSVGTSPQALTNADGEIDGARIQAQSISASRLNPQDDYTVESLAVSGNVTVRGGNVECGISGAQRGMVVVYHGSGNSAAGCIRLHSFNGSSWYLFVDNDGVLRIHNTLPTAANQGTIVGSQG